MAHISELALFQNVAGEAELTPEQVAHMEECPDCAELEIEFRQAIKYFTDLSKAKRFLVGDEELPVPEPPRIGES
jgi:hypothetical protein